MERLRLCKKFWKFPSRCFTFPANQKQPSPRMLTSYNLDSLNDLDLRVVCDQILALFQEIEDSGQDNTDQSRQRQREIWPKLSCIPILRELFAESEPDSSILETYFFKGESDPSTLAYIILRDVRASHHRLAVGLLCLGSALENWGNIDRNKDECFDEFKEMCYLAKLLYEVRHPMTEIQKLEEENYRGVDLLLQGSITCSVHANPSKLMRYLSVCSYRESLLELISRTKETCDNLRSILGSAIFCGVRSSPLEGRPGMSYPFHAVDIDREKEKIIDLLQWRSGRKVIAVIVEGPAGIGKTTVADAVFTSLHIPNCNYIRYTWFDRFHQVEPQMRADHWMRYWGKYDDREGQREKVNFDECEEDEDENVDGDGDGKEYYDESEDSDGEARNQSQGGREREPWVFDGEKDEMLQDLVYREDEDHYYYEDSDAEANKYRGPWLVNREDKTQHDLVYWESKADADAATRPDDVCFFFYFDNALWDLSDNSVWNLSRRLRYCLEEFVGENSGRIRIMVTTRDMESAMEECKSVLTEDCIDTYSMKPNHDGINNYKEKYVQILRSSMGDEVWQTLQWSACSSSSVVSNEQRMNGNAEISQLMYVCECIPGWLLLVGKFIATQPCALAAVQQLLSIVCTDTENDDANEKWQRLAKLLLLERKENYVTEEENERMDDALEMICFLFNGYPMKEIEDVFEEDVLKRLRDRGLLCVDNDDGLYAYVPYIIWQHVVATQNPRRCFIGSRPEAQAFDDQLQMDALQDEEKLIKILHLMNHDGGYDYDDGSYGPSYSMDASKLRWLARTLRALYSKFAYDPPQHGDDVCMEKLVIYECWRHAPLALHNCPNIRRLVLSDLENDDIIVDWIPVEVRYLNLNSQSRDIQLGRSSMSNVAKLKNLRSLNLHLGSTQKELTLPLPEELCIRELSITCHWLKELPDNFVNMKSLHVLKLECPSLKQLPDDFGRLSSLTELAFRECHCLKNVGRDVCTLQSLHTLHWTLQYGNWDDARLNDLMKMKSLRVLVLDVLFHGKWENDYYLRPPFLYHHPNHHVQVFYTDNLREHSPEMRN